MCVPIICAAAVASSVSSQPPQYVVTRVADFGGGSFAHSVNVFGIVTGDADVPGGVRHAFVFDVQGEQDLGTLGGSFSNGLSIASDGIVAGVADLTNNTAHHAFFQQAGGTMVDVGTLGGANSEGHSVNDSYEVVGSSDTSTSGVSHAFYWNLAGARNDLGTLGGSNSQARCINNGQQITGWANTADNHLHAFLYLAGSNPNLTMSDLGTLGGGNSDGYGINDSGQVTGYAHIANNQAYHAFLYSSGTMADLGTLGGKNSTGYAVNSSGQVLGTSDTAGNANHLFLYLGGTMYDLNDMVPASAGVTTFESFGAIGMNDSAQIAATALYPSIGHQAVLLTPRNMGEHDFSGGIGDVFGGGLGSVANGVATRAGHNFVVVGRGTNGVSAAAGITAFYWTQYDGMHDFLNNLHAVQSTATAVSSDNSTVVGWGDSGNAHYEPFRQRLGGSYQLLSWLPGHDEGLALAVSGDGSTVVGWTGVNNDPSSERAFVWSEANGTQPLYAGLTTQSAASGISADGNIVVGYDTPPATGASRAFIFNRPQGGPGYQPLGYLPGDSYSEASAVSADGAVAVGHSGSGSGYQAFRWKSGTMTALGDFAGGPVASLARATSGDGGIVVGYGTDAAGQKALVWDSAHGLNNLQSFLASQYGVDFSGWTLTDAKAISASGTAIAGAGVDPSGNTQAFVAHINTRTYRFMSGETYAGFHTSHLGGLGSTVDLLGGTAGGASGTFRTIIIDTSTNTSNAGLASDIANVYGSFGDDTNDTYVIQMSYDPLHAAAPSVAWFDGNLWRNAVDGNTSGWPVFIDGPYDGDATLGHHGVDSTNHVTWAVVDHQGTFSTNNAIATTTFARWQEHFFAADERNNPNISGDSADADGDGVINLLEYAFNTDPRQRNQNPVRLVPLSVNDARYLAIAYRKFQRATDLTYQIEESTDLKSWTAVSPFTFYGDISDPLTPEIIAGVPFSDARSGKLFLRLRVSR